MLHKNTLEAAHTVLAIIDMQEAFRSPISDFAELAARIALVTHAVQLLNIPVIITEQYPKGLGHTADEIKAVLPASFNVIEKTAFSSCGARSFEAELERTQALHVLICGVEAHVCVNQTTHDLLERGYRVHLLTDCISARAAQNKQIGLAKMQQSGAIPSSTELALFELLRDARHEQFKAIQKLIK
jgi:nicotinamidase-related amidase